MQTDQSALNLSLAVSEFRDFARTRLGGYVMEFNGQTFKHPVVQLAFEAFQAGHAPGPSGQLFARIREDSKYHHQIAWCATNGLGHPFPVRFRAALDRYVLEGGPGRAYRLADVDLYVAYEGELYLVNEGSKADE